MARTAALLVGLTSILVWGVGVLGASPGAKPSATCLGKRATIVGTARADQLSGTKRADVIAGLGGNDAINGLGAADLVCGGAGLDTLVGGAGADRLDGGPGFDVCRAGEKLAGCEETRPDAVRGADLKPGDYTTDLFRPRLSFEVGPDWAVRQRAPTAFQLAKRIDPGGMTLEFDSFGGNRSVSARIGQFAGMSGVNVDGPVSATIGGRAGQRVDLLVTAPGEVLVPGLTDRYELEPNDRLRVYVVNVNGTAVAILVEALAPDFAGFFADVDGVLASVKWA